MKRVFISYCRTDRKHASRASEAVRAIGWLSFIDEEDVPPGGEWRDIIRTALISSDLLLVILTPGWASSRWTKFELAVYSEMSKPKKAVLPLEFEPVSGIDHMTPMIIETQIVKASELAESELRWIVLCGGEARPPGPRHQWATKGLEATKIADHGTPLDRFERHSLSPSERLRLEDELISRIKSRPRILEIAGRVFGKAPDDLSLDSRIAWYQMVKLADDLDLIERLCEISKRE